MSIYMRLINFDQLRAELPFTPIIVNDLSITTIQEKNDLKQQIYTRYDTDVMSSVATCTRGCTTGEYYRDSMCPVCNTIVKSPLENELHPTLWMRAPKGVSKLMNPHVWLMASMMFKKSGFDLIQWLALTSYHPSVKLPEEAHAIQAAGIQRGYNYFVDNFFDIVKFLFSLKHFKKDKDAITRESFLRLITEYRNCIFSQFLPVPNKYLFVIESNYTGNYANEIIYPIVNAVSMIASIDYGEEVKGGTGMNRAVRMRQFDQAAKERRTAKMQVGMAEFLERYYKNDLGRKVGAFRKHVFATHSHFTFRAVISSITKPHRYDELHIPWSVGVGVFGIFLRNKLTRRGYTTFQIEDLLNSYANEYHPLLDELFKELIAESPQGYGIPIAFCRNPSLSRGSFQMQFITQVKTDPKDPTTSMSILNTVPYNADFDGDAMAGMLLLDKKLADLFIPHLPYMNAYDTNRPRTLSNNLSLSKPMVGNIASLMAEPDIRTDQSRMTDYLA